MFLILLIVGALAAERESFDPNSAVFILDDQNFQNITHAGDISKFEKPWFIMFYASWCPHCKRIISLWEDLALQFEGRVNFGAIECEDNPDVRDRIQVQGFPSLMFFGPDNKMYKYKEFRNLNNFTNFLENELWKSYEPLDIPMDINYWSRYQRILLSPSTIIITIILLISSLIGWIIYEENKQDQKQKKQR